MKKEIVIAGLIGGLIGIFILSFFFGVGDAWRGGFSFMMRGAVNSNIDRHFIEEMIPHHEGAIVMAKVALERSKRPEIISLANGIIGAQERENSDMRKWYKSWFNSIVPGKIIRGMHLDGMEGNTEVLKGVSAAEFDGEFIAQMIPHHEMAIMMAQMLLVSTKRPEMRELANQIITSQSREIEMMRSWFKSWYVL